MPTTHNFTGQRLDSQTGLLYYNARYYDPVSGRFTRADTMQNNTSGMDPYGYVGGNPETRNDPTGHCPFCVVAVLTAFIVVGAIGGAIGGAISTAIEGGLEGRTPSWEEYRDNIEVGALVGAFAGLIAPLLLVPGSQIEIGALIATGAGSFLTTAVGGTAVSIVRHLNGGSSANHSSTNTNINTNINTNAKFRTYLTAPPEHPAFQKGAGECKTNGSRACNDKI